jgi:hypothetical protein
MVVGKRESMLVCESVVIINDHVSPRLRTKECINLKEELRLERITQHLISREYRSKAFKVSKSGELQNLRISTDSNKTQIGKSARFGLVRNCSERPSPSQSGFSLGIMVCH